MKELADEVNAQGIKFGIWIEPEMVNEDSELYRKHPDWALVMPDRNPVKSRNQLVTNLEINLRQGFFRLYDSENITSRKISAQKFFINYLHNHFEDVSFVLQKHNVIL